MKHSFVIQLARNSLISGIFLLNLGWVQAESNEALSLFDDSVDSVTESKSNTNYNLESVRAKVPESLSFKDYTLEPAITEPLNAKFVRWLSSSSSIGWLSVENPSVHAKALNLFVLRLFYHQFKNLSLSVEERGLILYKLNQWGRSDMVLYLLNEMPSEQRVFKEAFLNALMYQGEVHTACNNRYFFMGENNSPLIMKMFTLCSVYMRNKQDYQLGLSVLKGSVDLSAYQRFIQSRFDVVVGEDDSVKVVALKASMDSVDVGLLTDDAYRLSVESKLPPLFMPVILKNVHKIRTINNFTINLLLLSERLGVVNPKQVVDSLLTYKSKIKTNYQIVDLLSRFYQASAGKELMLAGEALWQYGKSVNNFGMIVDLSKSRLREIVPSRELSVYRPMMVQLLLMANDSVRANDWNYRPEKGEYPAIEAKIDSLMAIYNFSLTLQDTSKTNDPFKAFESAYQGAYKGNLSLLNYVYFVNNTPNKESAISNPDSWFNHLYQTMRLPLGQNPEALHYTLYGLTYLGFSETASDVYLTTLMESLSF